MKSIKILLLAAAVAILSNVAIAQSPTMLKRTVTKTDRFDFGSGGTIVISGAPVGAVRVTGTTKNEVEITAEIQIEASTEADLAKLSEVTGFLTDESQVRASVITTGPHNKFGLKKLPKEFPKHLLTLPFSVSYTISVPRYSDLEIDGGKGDLSIIGVDGSMRVNFLESNAKVEISTGNALVMIGTGSLDLTLGARGWRGRYADVQVASGDLTVRLPSKLSAEIDANVLKTGSIENLIPDLKPRDRKVPFTERSIVAKAGVGGSPLKFVVGDGKLKLERLTQML